jgi:hypothetical protein
MRRIVDYLNTFVSVFVGAFLVGAVLRPDRMDVVFDLAGGVAGRIVLLAAGLVLLALNAVSIVLDIRAGLRARSLQLTTESGTNAVSVDALERQLLEDLERAGDIIDPRLHLEVDVPDHPIPCEITMKLRKQENVMGRIDEIKRGVRDRYVRMIPSGPGIDITCRVTDIVSEPARPRSGSDEFSGPVYPVGNGEGA